jgi:septal ring factor EnvC (AmiA/AmiB activator)
MTDRISSNAKTAVIGAMWALLLMVVGWQYSEAQTARAQEQAEIAQLRQVVSDQRERTARIEEIVISVQRQLDRIERSVDEVKSRVVK